ncbi:MAG: hypothetical protein ACNI26_12675 [Terasakiella sp.]|uniref:hypothetical protein n=1 Tax=unclassified Terasakiella TaxID=2614952 RepID=UPI003B004AD2
MADQLESKLGISRKGISCALDLKEKYKTHQPICVPGEKTKILMPENLLNINLDLESLEDPMPLSLMATRDPESPMSMAAAARLSPKAGKNKFVGEVMRIVADASKHENVTHAINMLHENDFHPKAIGEVVRQTNRAIVQTRKQFSSALRQNLHALLEGEMAPRMFVKEFFHLTENGNLRHDIRKRLVTSMLLSTTIRPSIKFLFLENFDRLPEAVRMTIIRDVLSAPENHHTEVIKEELAWIVNNEKGGSFKYH